MFLDQDKLPEDIQETVDILRNSKIKKLTKSKTNVLTTNMLHSSSFVQKPNHLTKDMKVGTEHLEVDYFEQQPTRRL